MSDTTVQSNGTFPRGFSRIALPRWPLVRADSIVELRYGRALTESARRPGRVPVYGTNGRCGWHDEPLSEGPGVIVGRKGMGNLGVEWSSSPFWVIDTAYYALPKTSELDLHYLYYLISYIGLNHLKDGTSNPSLNRDTFGSQLLPLPPIAVQRESVAILSALDEKIEQNWRTARVLERLPRAIFRAWFVDFEPVKAKSAGATFFPSVPQPVFDALPSRFVGSEIGPMPEGWEVKPIGDVVLVKGGATPSTQNPEYWDGVHCWATPRDMSRLSDPVLLDTERHITDAGVACISSGLLPVGTVLMSSRAPVGYLAVAGVPTAINQGFIAMICDGPLPPTYVLNWAQASMEAIHARASGTTFPEISKQNFRPLPVVVPPEAVVSAFRDTVDPLFDLLVACVKESSQLSMLRDYLLPRLLSGSVRVDGHG